MSFASVKKAGPASTSMLAPIERRTLNETAYERLRKALLCGHLEPGGVLTLRSLAAALGTSVMPVRDAVGRLVAEQALELLPNRGIRIPRLSPEEADEVWRLRIQLEGEAAGIAATRAEPSELDAIDSLRDAVERRARAGDLHGTLEANDGFQFAVYRAAKTRVLLRLIETLRMQSVPHCTAALRRLLDERPPFLDETLRRHDQLVAALRRRDAARATEVKRRDLESYRDWVERVAAEPETPARARRTRR